MPDKQPGVPNISPCPWCGTTTEVRRADDSYVRCTSRRCSVLGPESPTDIEAITAWNRVANAVAERDDLRRQVDTLREALKFQDTALMIVRDRQNGRVSGDDLSMGIKLIRDALAATEPKKGGA